MKNLIIFIFFISCKVFATPQIPDILIYNGKKYEWNSYSPAFKYLEDKQIKVPNDAISTTARSDFYTMTYSIENDSLYLINIEILTSKNSNLSTRSVFKELFPNQTKVLMNFYSVIQTFPYGKVYEDTQNNWTDIHYKKYLVFEFKNGYVETSYDMNYKSFLKLKKGLFEKFKKTLEYKTVAEEEISNLEAFNEFRPNKYSMDEYLEFTILRHIKTLKE